MDCLLEVYDREQINNILDVLAFSPKKAVFLYDPRTADAEDLRAVETACRLRLPRLEVEAVPADLGDLNAVYRACKGVVRRNEGCFVDITGGGELGAVGAYLACKETYSPIFIVDPPRGRLRSIAGCRELERSFRLPRFTMDVLLAAHGAAIAGYGHPKPDKSMHQALLSFCERVFDDIPRWKDLCLYLQTGCASFPVEDDRGRFYAPQEIASRGRTMRPHLPTLRFAEELGLIQELRLKRERLSFRFSCDAVKKYMTDFGTWLELYCYISLHDCGAYNDVRLSVKVDWDGERKSRPEVTNEIDVTFFRGVHPVFLSCKLAEPAPEALHELSVYKSYFGGGYSKCILATLSAIDRENTHIGKRAQEMDIALIDATDIREGRFLQRVAELF